MDVRITGARQLRALSKSCRAQGDAGKGFRRNLYRGIQRATKAPKAAAPQAALDRLPRRGGLAAEVGAVKMSTRTRGGGKNVGVQIVAKGKYLRGTDRGLIRKSQRVDPGWFSETMEESAPEVRAEILQAMKDTADEIRRSA